LPVKKAASLRSCDKKAPRAYLYAVILLNFIGVFFMFSLNQFGDGWMVFVTVSDLVIGLVWFILNIGLWVKFKRDRYEKKALVFPIYYVVLYLAVYFISATLAGMDIHAGDRGVSFFYWLTIITAVIEVAYAEFLLKDRRRCTV